MSDNTNKSKRKPKNLSFINSAKLKFEIVTENINNPQFYRYTNIGNIPIEVITDEDEFVLYSGESMDNK